MITKNTHKQKEKKIYIYIFVFESGSSGIACKNLDSQGEVLLRSFLERY
jgi:hypothetical protein